eukprot:1475009-Prorocentrum_lima.AAC.1
MAALHKSLLTYTVSTMRHDAFSKWVWAKRGRDAMLRAVASYIERSIRSAFGTLSQVRRDGRARRSNLQCAIESSTKI